MYILNIAGAIKRSQIIKSDTLSLRTMVNELDFFKANSYYSMKQQKREIYSCLRLILKNTVSYS